MAPERRGFEELRTTEILWLLNRVIFHPRGYAFMLYYPEGATSQQIMAHDVEPTGWSLIGDGKEPWRYADDVDEEKAYRTVESFLLQTKANAALEKKAAERAAHPGGQT